MADMELDHLDRLAADAFDGYIVRKDLVRKFARQYPVPTYVCEFLLGRYCASTNEEEIQEGLQIVERQLAEVAPEAAGRVNRERVVDQGIVGPDAGKEPERVPQKGELPVDRAARGAPASECERHGRPHERPRVGHAGDRLAVCMHL